MGCQAVRQDKGQASFSFGLKFQKEIQKADRAIGEADSGIHGFNYCSKEETEGFVLDAIEAMQQAQQAMGENTSIDWNTRKTFIRELQNGIKAMGERDAITAMQIVAKIRNLERL